MTNKRALTLAGLPCTRSLERQDSIRVLEVATLEIIDVQDPYSNPSPNLGEIIDVQDVVALGLRLGLGMALVLGIGLRRSSL